MLKNMPKLMQLGNMRKQVAVSIKVQSLLNRKLILILKLPYSQFALKTHTRVTLKPISVMPLDTVKMLEIMLKAGNHNR